ncbi:transcription antitermination factor NusB [Halieaceae bacterium IMCC14734]|uniref:Transcription antitermination protein NusB n=2 Tax=Candidatus Litorirhabdus singularis TaxID=2518993 RepID=A0ABT3TKE2_9GAMM|nr:transcription antitermination factor NusB [Candidatus Litorirhabdus singularis]MCX2982777.1 transcription antitermination factor NusB [Candidatus Litorirhabdus singularis]
MSAPSKPNLMAARRHRARHYAMQALYQWHMANASVTDIEAEFREEYDFDKVDGEYFHTLLSEIPRHIDELDELYAPFLVERSLAELGAVECALLRIGTFELRDRIDVPYRVVINEAVGLAKKFGAADSHKFVNGVLDKTARQLRVPEVAEFDASRRAPG